MPFQREAPACLPVTYLLSRLPLGALWAKPPLLLHGRERLVADGEEWGGSVDFPVRPQIPETQGVNLRRKTARPRGGVY